MINPLIVGEAQGLYFIEMKSNLDEIDERDAPGLEIGCAGHAGNASAFLGSRHITIISICS